MSLLNATKFNSPGDVITWTNGTGATANAGTIVDTGFSAGLVNVTTANGAKGEVTVKGVLLLAKPNNLAFAAGAKLYWDAGNSRVTTVAAVGAIFVGFCVDGAAETATQCTVRLAPYNDEGLRQLTLAAAATLTVRDFAGGGVILATNTTSAAFSVTMPTSASIGGGKIVSVLNTAGTTNVVTLARSGSTDTFNGATSYALIKAANDRATFLSVAGVGFSLVAATIA